MEVARVLDEEGALLGEEHLEALIDGDLGIVGLHLAEIGIDGPVEGEGVSQDYLGVEPRPLVAVGDQGGDILVEEAGARQRAVRIELDVARRRDVR